VSSKFEFIDGEKAHYPVVAMCRWARVSRSGFYEWRDRPGSATEERRTVLMQQIRDVFDDSDETYGYRRVWAELARQGVEAGLELVRALMRAADLVACQPRPWRLTTIADPAAPATPDLVCRDFTADAVGVKFVGDITYIPTWEGFVYLATVIDCHSKMVAGYALADHMRASLVCDAIAMAARTVRIAPDAIFHSDRGCQYTSAEFRKVLQENRMRPSMGRTGVCWDNAMAESFNAALKNERVYRTVYPTKRHAITDVTRYIEHRYNSRRIHSGLGYRTPQEVHNESIQRQLAA
jgi:transposase InsO family protein